MSKIFKFKFFLFLLWFTIFQQLYMLGKEIKENKKKILVIYGTNRKNSLTEQVANYYVKLLKENDTVVATIKLIELPKDFTVSALYENNGKDKNFNIFREKINNFRKIVIVTPEYNGSIPGVLKAFIDGLELPEMLTDKKVGMIGVSKGANGCIMGMSHLTDILNHLGAYVYPFKPRISKIQKEDIKEVLKVKEYVEFLNRHCKGFLEY